MCRLRLAMDQVTKGIDGRNGPFGDRLGRLVELPEEDEAAEKRRRRVRANIPLITTTFTLGSLSVRAIPGLTVISPSLVSPQTLVRFPRNLSQRSTASTFRGWRVSRSWEQARSGAAPLSPTQAASWISCQRSHHHSYVWPPPASAFSVLALHVESCPTRPYVDPPLTEHGAYFNGNPGGPQISVLASASVWTCLGLVLTQRTQY